MKKSFIVLASLAVLCLGLTGCGAKPEIMVSNLKAKNEMTNYQVTATLQMNSETYNIAGEVVNGVSRYDVDKNNADYTNMYINANDLYFDSGFLNELVNTWGDLEDTSAEYILVKGTNDKINLSNIDFSIVKKYMGKAIEEIATTYFTSNKDLVTVTDDTATMTLSGDMAHQFVNDFISYMRNNEGNIYDEIIASVPENMQNKYKSAKEKSTKKLDAYFDTLATELSLGEGATVVLQNKLVDGVYQEVLSFSDSAKTIKLQRNIAGTATETVVIPENYVNITELKPLSEKEQAAQLETFFEKSYPKAAQMKKDLLTLGYENATYKTSLDGITLYSTRPSKSTSFKHDIVDEISIELLGEWLSEVTIVSCLSKEDYERYGLSAINTYIEEMQGLINADFLIEIGDGVGTYENITENWEFYVTISELEIENNGLITIELISKQH